VAGSASVTYDEAQTDLKTIKAASQDELRSPEISC
jgi:hypothetical protein